MARTTTGATKLQDPGTTALLLAELSQCRRLSTGHAAYQSVSTRERVTTTGVTGTFAPVTLRTARPGGITAVQMSFTQGITSSVLRGVLDKERTTTGVTRVREGGTIAPQLVITMTMTIQVYTSL